MIVTCVLISLLWMTVTCVHISLLWMTVTCVHISLLWMIGTCIYMSLLRKFGPKQDPKQPITPLEVCKTKQNTSHHKAENYVGSVFNKRNTDYNTADKSSSSM